jgi:hypothetical protein
MSDWSDVPTADSPAPKPAPIKPLQKAPAAPGWDAVPVADVSAGPAGPAPQVQASSVDPAQVDIGGDTSRRTPDEFGTVEPAQPESWVKRFVRENLSLTPHEQIAEKEMPGLKTAVRDPAGVIKALPRLAAQIPVELGPGTKELAGKAGRALAPIGRAYVQGEQLRAGAPAETRDLTTAALASGAPAVSETFKSIQEQGEKQRAEWEKLADEKLGDHPMAKSFGSAAGKFAQLAVISAVAPEGVVPGLLALDSGVSAYDAAKAEKNADGTPRYTEDQAKNVALAKGGLVGVLMGIGIPKTLIPEAASVPDAVLKAILIRTPVLAGAQTVGDAAIDKVILDKNTSVAKLAETAFEHAKGFALFEAGGLVPHIPAISRQSKYYDRLGESFPSSAEAKASFVSDLIKAAKEPATTDSIRVAQSALNGLNAIEHAEKIGRNIKWGAKPAEKAPVEPVEKEVANAGKIESTAPVGEQPGGPQGPGREGREGVGQGVEGEEASRAGEAKKEGEKVAPESAPHQAERKAFSDLAPEDQQGIHDSLQVESQALVDNPEGADADFQALPESRNGQFVGGDDIRKLLPTFNKNRNQGTIALQTPSDTTLNMNKLAYRFKTAAIDRAVKAGKQVIISMGGPGSGKSTVAGEMYDNHGDLFGAVIDAPHTDFNTLRGDVQMATNRGAKVRLVFVDTPADVATRRMVSRAKGKEMRHVDLEDMSEAHSNAAATFEQALNEWGNDPDVIITHFEEGPNGERWETDSNPKDNSKDLRAVLAATPRESKESIAKTIKETYLSEKEAGHVPPDVQREIEHSWPKESRDGGGGVEIGGGKVEPKAGEAAGGPPIRERADGGGNLPATDGESVAKTEPSADNGYNYPEALRDAAKTAHLMDKNQIEQAVTDLVGHEKRTVESLDSVDDATKNRLTKALDEDRIGFYERTVDKLVESGKLSPHDEDILSLNGMKGDPLTLGDAIKIREEARNEAWVDDPTPELERTIGAHVFANASGGIGSDPAATWTVMQYLKEFQKRGGDLEALKTTLADQAAKRGMDPDQAQAMLQKFQDGLKRVGVAISPESAIGDTKTSPALSVKGPTGKPSVTIPANENIKLGEVRKVTGNGGKESYEAELVRKDDGSVVATGKGKTPAAARDSAMAKLSSIQKELEKKSAETPKVEDVRATQPIRITPAEAAKNTVRETVPDSADRRRLYESGELGAESTKADVVQAQIETSGDVTVNSVMREGGPESGKVTLPDGKVGLNMLAKAGGKVIRRAVEGAINAVRETRGGFRDFMSNPLVNLAKQLDEKGMLQRLYRNDGEFPVVAHSMIDPTLPKPVGDMTAGRIGQELRSPHSLEREVFEPAEGFTLDRAIGDNDRMMKQAAYTQWAHQTLKGVRDVSRVVQTYMDPIAKRIFDVNSRLAPLIKGREAIEKAMEKFDVMGGQSVMERDATKAAEKQSGFEKELAAYDAKHGAEIERLTAQKDAHYAAAKAQIAKLAKKHADVRVALLMDAGAKPEQWLKDISTKEDIETAKKMSDGMAKFKLALQERGIPTLDLPYITHLIRPLDAARFDTPEGLSQIREVMAFHSREKNSINLFPTVHGAMSYYIPSVSRKLAYQPLLSKWLAHGESGAPNPYLDITGDHYAPKFGSWLNEQLREMQSPKQPGVLEPLVSAVKKFEILKTIAMSPRVAVKHAVKTTNLIGLHHTFLLPAMKDMAIMYARKAENAPLIGRALKAMEASPDDAELTQALSANLMATKQIAKMLREDPLVADYEHNIMNKLVGPSLKGVVQPIKNLGTKAMNLMGYPTTAVETFENGLNMLASIRKGQQSGLDAQKQVRATMMNVLDYNYRGGSDAAKYLKSQVGNTFVMFSMTPAKGLELQAHILDKGIRGEKDVFGGDTTAQLIRHIMVLGAIGYVGKKKGHDFFKMMFHVPPPANTEWANNMVKFAYNSAFGTEDEALESLAAAAGDYKGAISMSPIFSAGADLVALGASWHAGSVMPMADDVSAVKQAKVLAADEPPPGYETKAHYFTSSPTEEEQQLRENRAKERGIRVLKPLLKRAQ